MNVVNRTLLSLLEILEIYILIRWNVRRIAESYFPSPVCVQSIDVTHLLAMCGCLALNFLMCLYWTSVVGGYRKRKVGKGCLNQMY
jgi:hypothetical protein